MRVRILAAVFAVCSVAMGQTMSVDQLVQFIKSSQKLIEEKKQTDQQVAKFLKNVKLTERLDDRTIELLQGSGDLGAQTLHALQALRDRSQELAAAKPIVIAPPPELPPPPSSEEQAAILDEVRNYALNYSRTLPDYICTQVTRRFAAPAPGTRYGGRVGGDTPWQLLDTLTIRLSYFEQKEDYKLIMVNNSVTTQDYKTLGGSTSFGDFGTMMRQIFEHKTEARFEWDHWATLRKRPTMAFSYHVSQAKSQWHLNFDRKFDIVPSYHGLIYVDTKTHQVTRITLEADNIPPDFPIHKAQTILDYAYTDISGHTFLLPVYGEMQMATSDYVTKNEQEFRMYHKYTTEAEIRFDTETPPPLPEDQKKEEPAGKKQEPPAKKK